MEKSLFSAEYVIFLRLLRDARAEAGLTQAELGTRLGQTQSFVSKCERGERRIDLIEARAFCQALSVDFSALISALEEKLDHEK